MGTSFQIPILSVDSLEEAQQVMNDWIVDAIYAATMEDSGDVESMPHYDVAWSQHHAELMIGSEGNGLSANVRRAVASREIRALHVPMEVGVESSVILFEYLRQCRSKTIRS